MLGGAGLDQLHQPVQMLLDLGSGGCFLGVEYARHFLEVGLGLGGNREEFGEDRENLFRARVGLGVVFPPGFEQITVGCIFLDRGHGLVQFVMHGLEAVDEPGDIGIRRGERRQPLAQGARLGVVAALESLAVQDEAGDLVHQFMVESGQGMQFRRQLVGPDHIHGHQASGNLQYPARGPGPGVQGLFQIVHGRQYLRTEAGNRLEATQTLADFLLADCDSARGVRALFARGDLPEHEVHVAADALLTALDFEDLLLGRHLLVGKQFQVMLQGIQGQTVLKPDEKGDEGRDDEPSDQLVTQLDVLQLETPGPMRQVASVFRMRNVSTTRRWTAAGAPCPA
jgi:hypothetical protein